jgi:hypothetical protein
MLPFFRVTIMKTATVRKTTKPSENEIAEA